MPSFIPEPFDNSKYSYKIAGHEAHLYISQFVEMDVTSASNPAELANKLAKLYQLTCSASRSPHGKAALPKGLAGLTVRRRYFLSLRSRIQPQTSQGTENGQRWGRR